jgi:hypothetical protein
VQLKAISEQTGKPFIVGNYYKIDEENDADNLFDKGSVKPQTYIITLSDTLGSGVSPNTLIATDGVAI